MVREKICRKLDIRNETLGGDFRTFAGHLAMPNEELKLVSQQSQPTHNILSWWERTGEATVARLRDVLVKIERRDCVNILDEALD